MKHGIIYWLMLPPALVLCLVSLGIAGVVLSSVPPLVSWVAAGILAVVVGWFIFGRHQSSTKIAGSESSLMGRQSSKEGLL